MSWALYHSQSEHYASLAEEAVQQDENDRALDLYRLAAEAEGSALEILDPAKTRTLGITVVSAVSLWFKAQEFRQAERLAYQWLMTDLLPSFAVQQLQDLLLTIWEKTASIQQRA
ncbi:MAG: hypothetical protein MUF49_32900 [Oculatellaceae cyanobacterium Prado106]|jgi:hypothetical protein|nr:hypothetical protein [Oculatellaceae cyanobacterium Prado106]